MGFNRIPIATKVSSIDYSIIALPLQSGSYRRAGTFLSNDTSPSIGTMSPIDGTFYDGRFDVPYAVGTGNYSIGFWLTGTKDVHGLTLFDYDDGTIGPGMYQSGSNVGLYVLTTMNGTVWSLAQRYYPINRQHWSGSIYRTELPLGDGINDFRTCTQIKINAFSGSLKSANGSYLKPSEMIVWTMPSKVGVGMSGSLVRTPKVTLTPIKNIGQPQGGSGAPINTNFSQTSAF